MILVIDASVAVKWFFHEPGHEAARELEQLDADFVAPEILLAEVANAVWRKHRLGECPDDEADAIVDNLAHFFELLQPLPPLIKRASSLSRELDHPIYDCLYLACAEMMSSPLLTDDNRLLQTVSGTPLARTVFRLGATLPPSMEGNP